MSLDWRGVREFAARGRAPGRAQVATAGLPGVLASANPKPWPHWLTGPGSGPLLEPLESEMIQDPAKAQHARTPADDMTVRLVPLIGGVLNSLPEGRCDLADPVPTVAIEIDLRPGKW